jgi:hypothetical protein
MERELHDMELNDLRPYNVKVTIAGDVRKDSKVKGNGSTFGRGSGSGSNGSSDAILRIEDVDANGAAGKERERDLERGIFRTTEVTVVTS